MANCERCLNKNDCNSYEPHSTIACSNYQDVDDVPSKKFKVKVREILSRTVEVDAENMEEAMDKVRDMYRAQEIILDSEDFDAPAEICILDKNYKPFTKWEEM